MSDRSCKVFVGSLDWKISGDDLKDHMRSAGDVVFVNILQDRDGRSRGSGIVEYKTPEGATTAIKTLNDSMLGERLIFVREDREAGKGGGKGGGKGKGGWDAPKGKGRGKGEGKGRDKGYDDNGYGGKGGSGKGGKGGNKGYDDNGYGGKDSSGKGGKGKYSAEDKGRVVYVGNLPFRASWQDLKDVFKNCGNVIRAEMAKDYDGRSRGYAKVLFESEGDAISAIDNLNETDFDGRKMVVRLDTYA